MPQRRPRQPSPSAVLAYINRNAGRHFLTPKRGPVSPLRELGEEGLCDQGGRMDCHAGKRLAMEGPEVRAITGNQRFALQPDGRGQDRAVLFRDLECRAYEPCGSWWPPVRWRRRSIRTRNVPATVPGS